MKSPLTSLRPAALLPESTRQLLRAVGRRFHDGRCAQVAGSLAFTTLLSLVPFVTLVAVVFSRLPQSAQGRRCLPCRSGAHLARPPGA